jgi:hypothetical protein
MQVLRLIRAGLAIVLGIGAVVAGFQGGPNQGTDFAIGGFLILIGLWRLSTVFRAPN